MGSAVWSQPTVPRSPVVAPGRLTCRMCRIETDRPVPLCRNCLAAMEALPRPNAFTCFSCQGHRGVRIGVEHHRCLTCGATGIDRDPYPTPRADLLDPIAAADRTAGRNFAAALQAIREEVRP